MNTSRGCVFLGGRLSSSNGDRLSAGGHGGRTEVDQVLMKRDSRPGCSVHLADWTKVKPGKIAYIYLALKKKITVFFFLHT